MDDGGVGIRAGCRLSLQVEQKDEQIGKLAIIIVGKYYDVLKDLIKTLQIL